MRLPTAPAALVALSLIPSAVARAQDGFDAHDFVPAALDGDPRSPLVVARPSAFAAGDWWLAALGEYAESPLVEVRAPAPGEPGEEIRALDNVVAANLSAGVAVHERLRFDAAAPVYVSSVSADQANPASFGDIRLTALVVPVRPPGAVGGGGFGLGLLGHVDLPTGNDAAFLGSSGIAGGARLALTGEVGSATFGADVGAQIRPAIAGRGNLTGSDAAILGVSVGALASPDVGLTAEIVARPAFAPGSVPGAELPIEAIGTVRYRNPIGGFLVAGGAFGVTDAVGVPVFRAFVGGGFGKEDPPRPLDFDPVGSLASRDGCPTEAEIVNGWRDEDGCPDQLGALALDIRLDGEPWTAVAEITGPNGLRTETIGPRGLTMDAVPGTQWDVTARDGCLIGQAGAMVAETGTLLRVDLKPRFDARVVIEVVGPDGIPLAGASATWMSQRPMCVPQTPAFSGTDGRITQDIASGSTHGLVVTAPGYTVFEQALTLQPADASIIRVDLKPTLIKLEAEQIVILEKVQFETGRSTIRPASYPLLDEVGATIVTHPEIGRVEVAGHTDAEGADVANLRLSQDRADAVRAYLVKQGVPVDRLLSVGYGEGQPLETNRTAEGRERNRRVEFVLVDRKQQGGAP